LHILSDESNQNIFVEENSNRKLTQISSNAKDIGILYLIFALFSGLL
jgi:hypothetical protein